MRRAGCGAPPPPSERSAGALGRALPSPTPRPARPEGGRGDLLVLFLMLLVMMAKQATSSFLPFA